MNFESSIFLLCFNTNTTVLVTLLFVDGSKVYIYFLVLVQLIFLKKIVVYPGLWSGGSVAVSPWTIYFICFCFSLSGCH